MAYKHGIYFSESQTSVLSPAQSFAGLPVVFGTAPIHLAEDQTYVNKPVLAFNYGEAAKKLGYHSDREKYTLCEFMDSQFQLYNSGPVVFVNVLDPAVHKTDVADQTKNLVAGKVTIDQDGVLLSSVKVKLNAGGPDLVKNTDYTIAFNGDGKPIITRIAGGGITSDTSAIIVSYSQLNPSAVTDTHIIGGVDSGTGAVTGMELVNQVFPLFRLVPGQILAPGWSHKPTVAAVMKAKANNINGLFKSIEVVDLDSSSTGADLYSEVPNWKNTNNYTDKNMPALWPKAKLGTKEYHLSSHFAGLVCKTDAENGDIPFVSPSNKSLQIDGLILADGKEVILGPEQANYLNGEGIITALNWIGGHRLWGNRTAAYPANTDVKDSFVPVRRMFNWISNTVVLTYWQTVDNPMNRRQIDTVVDSVNIWLNGLTAQGAVLGGRIAFLEEENPTTDLLNGIVRFHLYTAPPTPAEAQDFVMEYDVNYLQTLFG